MITVFGSINMDLVAIASKMPRPGETVAGLQSSASPGGKGANQALAARRAGAGVRMAGAVGHDPFGAEALALLKDASVDLSLVRAVEQSTGTAHVVVDAGGENAIVVVPGANGQVEESDARCVLEGMKAGETLVLQMEIPPRAVEAALVAARAKGVVSIFNVAPMTSDAIRLYTGADIVVANETEFEALVGAPVHSEEQRLDAMKRLHAQSGRTLVVTLGADGAVAIHAGDVYRAEGLKITPVDTVGAGDTFCGYLAAALDAGLDFASALRRAVVAGSLACTKSGAQPAIPLMSEVQARL